MLSEHRVQCRRTKTQSSQFHWKYGDVPCSRNLFLAAWKGHPTVPSWSGTSLRHVLKGAQSSTWWHHGPRIAATAAMPHWRSGTAGSFFHNLLSSSSHLSVKVWMNASVSFGEPNTFTSSGFQTSSPKLSDVLKSDSCPVPNAGLPCVLDPALVSNVVPVTLCNGRARCGRDRMCVSSKNATKCSPGAHSAPACRQRVVNTRTEQQGHVRIPLLAACPCLM